jgi:hypothetical protein
VRGGRLRPGPQVSRGSGVVWASGRRRPWSSTAADSHHGRVAAVVDGARGAGLSSETWRGFADARTHQPQGGQGGRQFPSPRWLSATATATSGWVRQG